MKPPGEQSPQRANIGNGWDSIAPLFAPPAQYAGQMGNYRSVMKFDDGSEVKTPADWPRRRAEIRAYWDEKLGKWPPLLDKPEVTYLEQERIENVARHKIQIELARDLMREAYLFIPEGKGPFSAVVSVYYDAATSANLNLKTSNRSYGYDLAKRGFVTLCLGNPGADVRKPDDYPIQPLMFLAYLAANANVALAQMPQVDPRRIGIIGHSFGGKWALFASCLCDKYAAAVWSDPGIVWEESDPNANYWEPWYLGRDAAVTRARGVVTETNPRTGPYKELVAEHHDLHELAALMAPRPFLVSGGEQDPPAHWVALNGTIALCKFLRYKNRVAMSAREGHSPTVESNEQAYRFLEHFLIDMPAEADAAR